jgi:hypothetical protein
VAIGGSALTFTINGRIAICGKTLDFLVNLLAAASCGFVRFGNFAISDVIAETWAFTTPNLVCDFLTAPAREPPGKIDKIPNWEKCPSISVPTGTTFPPVRPGPSRQGWERRRLAVPEWNRQKNPYPSTVPPAAAGRVAKLP